MSQAKDKSQRYNNGPPTYQRRQNSGNHRPEHQQQGNDSKRNRQELRTAQVTFAYRLNVFVKDRSTANTRLQIRNWLQEMFQLGQKLDRGIGIRLEHDIDIRGMAILRNLPWIVGEAYYARNLRPVAHFCQSLLCLFYKLRAIRAIVLAGEEYLYY